MLLHVPRISFVHARLFSGLGAPRRFIYPLFRRGAACTLLLHVHAHDTACIAATPPRAHLLTRRYLKDYLSIDHRPATVIPMLRYRKSSAGRRSARIARALHPLKRSSARKSPERFSRVRRRVTRCFCYVRKYFLSICQGRAVLRLAGHF